MKYFLLFMLIFLISCGSTEKFDCSNCKENEICNESEKKCELKTAFDCSSCKDYEDCNQELEKCILKEGNCVKNENCDINTQICDLTTHTCKTKETPNDCTNGATKCDGNNLLTCSNNIWTNLDCSTENKICKTESNISSCVEDVVEDGTIYPIRHGDIAVDTEVSVKAIVTGIKVDNNNQLGGFYIQEDGLNYRGIYVYAKNPYENNLIIGDEVNVTGIYKEYHDLSEIIIEASSQVVKTGVNSPRENFYLLNINNLVTQSVEEYESMIVSVKGDFTVGDRDTTYNLSIKDANGNIFFIRDDLYKTELNKGDKFSEIRGVLSYNFGKFKIFPRGDYDLIDNTAVCSTVSCGVGEICEVTDNTPSCTCDTQNSYYEDTDGTCKNPCKLDNVCTQENKHKCVATNATDFTCKCDTGFQDNEGTCEAIPYCNPAIYSSAFGLTGNDLKTELNHIVKRSFVSYGYDDGRIAMFSYIDNYNGQIRCIYTGEYASHPYVSDKALLHKGCDGCADKPDNAVWNWEHTWPKSKGTGTMPAKADLHHLFPTRSYVNSARSSEAFGDVTDDGSEKYCDDGSSSAGSCNGYSYVSKSKSGIFEVADQHKGDTARAMLYIYVTYNLGGPDYLNTPEGRVLKEWDSIDPVDDQERGRNDRVEEFQHNRNPFVDCPQFVDALYQ